MAEFTETEKQKFAAKKKLRKILFVIFTVVLYAIMLILIFTKGIEYWPTYMVCLVIYTLLGFGSANSDELGTMSLFGKATWTIRNGGVAWGPAGFCTFRKDPSVLIKLRIGTPVTDRANQPVIVEDDSKAKIYVKNEPMRITFAAPKTAQYSLIPEAERIAIGEFGDDPLNQRITQDPNVLVTWQIDDHARFLEEVGTVEAANELLLESASSGLAVIAGKLTPAMAIRHQDYVEGAITHRVELRVGEWDDPADPHAMKKNSEGGMEPRYKWLGMDVLSAQVTSWGMTRRVNEAQANVGQERFNAQSTVVRSEAARTKLINEGQGTADARKTFMLAEAAGTEEMAKASNTSEALIIQWMQTMRDALSKSQYSLLPGSQNILSSEGFVSAAAGIQEAVKRLDEAKKTSKPASV